MDGQHLELFRKLTAGTKINVQRFRKDLEILKILKPKPVDDTKKAESSLRKGKKRKAEAVTCENGDGRKKKKVSPKLEHNTSSPPASDSSDDEDGQLAAALSDTDAEESSVQSDGEESSPQSDEGMPSPPPSVDRDSGEEEEEEDSRPVSSERRKKKKKKKKSAQLLAQLHKEEMNHVRNQHRINTYGTDIPDPVTSFEELQAEHGLHERVLENVREAGYKQPTPIQMQAIPIMMKRRNIMACAPTGSGKTAAFILPILHHLKEPRNCGIRALVLAPTRELAKQIFREFHKLSEGRGLRIQYIDKASRGGAKVKKCDIVVTTPNRMVFMLQQEPPQIDLSSVEWMIVDESDKLFEDGKTGFRNQLAVIYKACDSSNVRRGMFSATFAEDVQEWCRLHLDNVAQVYIGTRNTATSTVEQKLVFVGQECGKLFEMRQMIQQGLQPPVLVFVQSKERAKQLYFELLYLNVSVDVIHADKTQLQRDNVVRAFREGKIWVLICTELMGRGIDFKGVNLVINYDFPTSAISYIHRIGRTGRAGQPGKAITFFTLDDHPHLKSIANVMREAGCEVPDFLLKLGRPPKKERKKLARQQVKRKPISKAYKKDRAQLKRKRQLKAKIFKQGKGKSKKTGTDVTANS